MTDETQDKPHAAPAARSAVRVRLPGFVQEEQIGLGDVVTRTAYTVGITPCGGCQRRAQVLNRWVSFTR